MKEKEKLILNLLKNSKQDLPLKEISEKCKISRITAARYLDVLEAKGLIQHRAVGKAKLYSVKR